MSGKIRIQLNSAGVREMLRSTQMQSIVSEHAEEIAKRCGDGYGVSAYRGKNRVNASVGAETAEAAAENMRNNTILKAVRR